jgi:hypothetical protein
MRVKMRMICISQSLLVRMRLSQKGSLFFLFYLQTLVCFFLIYSLDLHIFTCVNKQIWRVKHLLLSPIIRTN